MSETSATGRPGPLLPRLGALSLCALGEVIVGTAVASLEGFMRAVSGQSGYVRRGRCYAPRGGALVASRSLVAAL
jgi:hypothetical protein